ncbi:hypothetical protein UCRPC4_g04920 [Phaeomoniella chlamydospora]|uniref:Selenoprotein O n=1 Tax=Phaeomoniella chlamydospora TaxID=158046 RepID=A0A0G2E7Z4_PHACM|nr:hypothetical protein UCRPC4_g04920 [Phaeomoniella chlamydospora]
MVRDALFTYVRPTTTEEPELLAVSAEALQDIGLEPSEASTEFFKEFVVGNKFFWSEGMPDEGVYPWAQCYGGWQFGQWAGQLGDGRAISLVETTNPKTGVRYEIQVKGAGRTPYSRFADGKAVLRSSIREFIVSEYLNAIKIPSTRALSLSLCPKSQVVRERLEPGAIVARFAQSWIRIGTFDIQRSRGDRSLMRTTAEYVTEHVFGGWDKLPGVVNSKDDLAADPHRNVAKDAIEGDEGAEENRFTRLYREVVRRNAKTVAAWQAYGFMNGVLNTDNTSIMGLSLDFGPFAFMDNFDPHYTPNHDDAMLRYSYRNQPTIIWWNLVRLGESLGELIGAGDQVDEEVFATKGVHEDFAPKLIKRAETLIDQIGEEYKAVFMAEYKRLMSARLGLTSQKESDFQNLFSEVLDTMEALELDFNHLFRRLSSVKVGDLDTDEKRKQAAKIFFHHEGVTGLNQTEDSASEMLAKWLDTWRQRVIEDWGESNDGERISSMKSLNPNFVPRGWLLDEIIERVEKKNDREILDRVMNMTLNPFQDEWGANTEEEKRFCGDVPRFQRLQQCSCSS